MDNLSLEEFLAMHKAADDNEGMYTKPKPKPPWTKDQVANQSHTVHAVLTLESILNFGKYKGEQVEDLMYDHPGYISWMVEKEVREFTQATLDYFKQQRVID